MGLFLIGLPYGLDYKVSKFRLQVTDGGFAMMEKVLNHFSPVEQKLLKIAENKFSKLAKDCEHKNGDTCLEIDQTCEFLKCPLKEEEAEEE